MTQSLQHVPLRRRAQRWGALIAAFAVAFMASVVGGTSPVAQATLVTMGIVTTSDGSGSTLDTATDNGIVATNESVTFEWNLSSQGTESVLVQTLPDCWEWDTTSFDLAGLNASNSQYTAAATANGTVLTVDVTIPDGSLTSVTFSGITAHPTGCAVDGSTYTPTLDATDDDGGTYSDAADELTVVSEERVELLKTDVFNGANQHATCDFGLGDEPCSFIRYRVTLYPPEGTDHLGAADLVLTEPVLLTDTYTITPPTGGPAVTDDLLEVVSVNPSTVTVSESGGVFSLTNLPQPIERVNIFFNIYIPDRQLSCCASVRIDNRIEADFMTANGAVVEPDPSNNATQNTLRATPAGLSFSAFHHKGVYVATSDPAYFTVNPRPSNSSWDRVSGSFVQTGSIIADSLLFRAEYVLGDSTEATLLQMHNFSDPSLQQIIDGVPPLVTYNNNTPLVAGTDYDTLTVEYTSGTDSANPENNTWEPSIAAAGGPEAVAGVRFTFTNLDLPQNIGDSLNDTAYAMVTVPYQIVGDEGDTSTDTFVIRGGTADNATEYNLSDISVDVRIQNATLVLFKNADDTSIVSGDDITYTVVPWLFLPSGGTGPVDVNGLTVVDTLPIGVTDVDTSALDPAWTVEQTGDLVNGFVLTFTHDPVAVTGTMLPWLVVPNIVYTVTSSLEAPPGGEYVNRAVIDAEGTGQIESERDVSEVVTVGQAQVSTAVKSLTGPPTVGVDEPSIQWWAQWFNFQNTATAASTFYDILPYDGDGRGSDFDGTATLGALELTGDSVGETILVTEDSVTSTADLIDPVTTWVDIATLTDLSGVTAWRVDIGIMESGYSGGVLVTMNVEGHQEPNVYVNDVYRFRDSTLIGTTDGSRAEVSASSVAGIVWFDANEDGIYQDSEELIEGATVVVSGGFGTFETTTDNAGAWLVDQLASPDYTVTVSTTVPGATFTLQNEGDDDTIDSDVDSMGQVDVTLGADEEVVDVDGGVFQVLSAGQFTKAVSGLDDGSTVPWSFSFEVTDSADAVVASGSVAGVGNATSSFTLDVTSLVPGATYTLSESLESGYTFGQPTCTGVTPTVDVVAGSFTFVAPGDGADEFEFDCVINNSAQTVNVGVVKTLSGDGAAFEADTEFGYEVTCTKDGADVALDNGAGVMVAGVVVVAGAVPVGSECTFVETDVNGALSTTANGEAGTTVTVTADTVVNVTFDNEFGASDLRVTKAVEGAGAGFVADRVFSFEVECSYRGVALFVDPMVAELGDDGEFLIEDLPIGAECVATETDAGGAVSTQVNGVAGSSVALVVDDEIVQTAAFTNSFAAGSLLVVKTVTGSAAGDHLSDVFEFTVACTVEGDPVMLDTVAFSLSDGEEFSQVVPLGAECVVAETDAGGGTAIFDGVVADAVTFTAVAENVVSVENEFVSAPTSVLPIDPPDPDPDVELPESGSDVGGLLLVAGLFLAVGLALLFSRRRRSSLRV